MQVVPSIKAEPYDVRMDMIVTEKRVILPEAPPTSPVEP
jgi:5-formyltetrahydrofolate cyclo-ligase